MSNYLPCDINDHVWYVSPVGRVYEYIVRSITFGEHRAIVGVNDPETNDDAGIFYVTDFGANVFTDETRARRVALARRNDLRKRGYIM